jgi:hypothetical protein
VAQTATAAPPEAPQAGYGRVGMHQRGYYSSGENYSRDGALMHNPDVAPQHPRQACRNFDTCVIGPTPVTADGKLYSD